MNSQCGLPKGRSCLTNLVAFYNKMMEFVYKERVADFVYLYLSVAFETVFCSILIARIEVHYDVDRWHELNVWTLETVIVGLLLTAEK